MLIDIECIDGHLEMRAVCEHDCVSSDGIVVRYRHVRSAVDGFFSFRLQDLDLDGAPQSCLPVDRVDLFGCTLCIRSLRMRFGRRQYHHT